MIEFNAVKIVNPTDLEAPRLYYAKAVKRGEIQLNTLAREISEGTALATAGIHAALYCLLEIILRYLSVGFYVKLGDFGIFYPSLKTCGLEKPEKVIASTVSKVKVMLCGSQLMYSVGQASNSPSIGRAIFCNLEKKEEKKD